MTWVIEDDNGGRRELETRAEAEDAKADLEQLGATVELRKKSNGNGESEHAGGNSTDSDDEKTTGIDVCVHCGQDIENGHCPDCEGDEPTPVAAQDAVDAIETVKDGSLDTDPLNILPGFMTDQIQGQQAVNKRGYAMIAVRYDIEVSTEMVQSPWDNDEGRVVCKATAITDDGRTHNAYGTACADDSDDPANLIELADTRSQKRAVQWASGFGIVGYQELTGQLEGDQ